MATTCIETASASQTAPSMPRSWSRIARSVWAMRSGTSWSRTGKYGLLVARAWLSDELTRFAPASTTATMSASAQASGGATETAYEPASVPSLRQWTKPSGIERQAEPEPDWRVRIESSRSSSLRPVAATAANVRAAKADADEAIPASAGKLLADVTCARVWIFARARTRSSCATTRSYCRPLTGCSGCSYQAIATSSWASPSSKVTVVVVEQASRFIETDSL